MALIDYALILLQCCLHTFCEQVAFSFLSCITVKAHPTVPVVILIWDSKGGPNIISTQGIIWSLEI